MSTILFGVVRQSRIKSKIIGGLSAISTSMFHHVLHLDSLSFLGEAQEIGHNSYVSAVDKTLTIHRIGVLPVTDNVNGLYGRLC